MTPARSAMLAVVLVLPLASRPAHAVPAAPATMVLAFEVDREQATLVGFTAKDRPFTVSGREEQATPEILLDVTLRAPRGGVVATAHARLHGLCLEHGPDAAPHVHGDRIQVHRDTVTVELPLVPGADTLDLALAGSDDAFAPRALGTARLDASRFVAAGSDLPYAALGLAAGDDHLGGAPASAGTPTVHWPEEYGDPDRVRVYGDPAENARRIHVVIVPDGYTHAQKALLQAHADALVAGFRARTPYKEHDAFINYDLVYAYSSASGTDQCDCGTVADTAMGTRFPAAGGACGSDDNRCLYYGTANGGPDCDASTSSTNIAQAELRAPAHDTTIVMVNTARYGGCGGSRAVYSAGNATATEIAIHELGHSLADLYDEYGGYPECGSDSGPNVSTNATTGSWPEWVGELGAPRQGASTYDSCVFRPSASCEMRALGQPFCKVCQQRFALTFFGHARVRDTAPIAGQSPAASLTATPGSARSFAVTTRLASGAGVTNRITWRLRSPGNPAEVEVGAGSPSLSWTFATPGVYTLTCEVAADTNFIKDAVAGANVDVATWTVTVGDSCTPPAFAGISAVIDLDLCATTGVRIAWSAASFAAPGGTYEITRDALPLASGLTVLSYVDHPGDTVPHEYRVRAVSGGSCSSPGTVPVATVADNTRPGVLEPVGNVLYLTRAGSDVRVRWADLGSAESYEVGAAPSLQPATWTAIGTATTGAAGVVDAGAVTASGARSYRVRQARCGVGSQY